MTASDELRSVIAHIEACTRDPRAWTRGLTQNEIVTASMTLVLSESPELGSVVAKIRANHPMLFDARTGAPVPPKPVPPAAPDDPGGEQQGAGATALKKAESDLVQQNTSTAMLDLLVISAILNAHAKVGAGADRLRTLQREIDEAVQNRTDLNTAAGARDFQRFLIGKLREIAAVVEGTDLDDRSKAALATAWSALYESSKAKPEAEPQPSAAGAPDAGVPDVGTPPEDLPVYGSDLPMDPLSDPLLGLDAGPLESMAPQAMPTTSAAPPTFPAAATMPTGSGIPTALPTGTMPIPGSTDEMSPAVMRRPGFAGSLDDAALDELLAAERAAMDAEPKQSPEDNPDDAAQAESETREAEEPAEPKSTVVELPNGEHVTAPTPELAAALRAALAGTPVVEAFHQQGITIPPAGSAVPHPVDPARVATGDVAMFSDRQGVALDQDRAWLDGQITPVDSVSGPSFLGWLHPPDPAKPGAAAPDSAAAPAPTRPAVVAGRI